MTRYQLSLYAEKLPRGLLRRPNPFAVATVTGGPREGEEIGKTDVVENTLDPDWTSVLFLETDSSVFLPFKVSVYNARNDELLADATFEATEVAEAPGHSQFQEHKNGAKIFASIEESMKGDARGTCTLQIRGLDIKNVEPGLVGLGRSDPFYEISRKNADHAAGIVRWNSVYRSEPIYDHLNPFWNEFTLSLETICYGDLNWPLKIIVYDHQQSGRHRTIGQFETTLNTLMGRTAVRGNADREAAFEIFTEGKTKTKGLIVILKADVQLEQQQQQQNSRGQHSNDSNTPYQTTTGRLEP